MKTSIVSAVALAGIFSVFWGCPAWAANAADELPITSAQITKLKAKAEAGDVDVQAALCADYNVGYRMNQDKAEALKWCRLAADQGNKDGQLLLGNWYYRGENGLTKDEAEGIKWYQKAAEQGHPSAQNALGYAYENGKGVPVDETEAVKWYKKAAEQGNESAQYNLGRAYYYGYGIAKNADDAIRWFQKAADQGNIFAQNALRVLDVSPKDKDKVKGGVAPATDATAAPAATAGVAAPVSLVTLLCEWDEDGKHYARNMVIDATNKTVDSHPAQFVGNAVKVDIPFEGGRVDHLIINRLNGDFSEVCAPCVTIQNGTVVPYTNAKPAAGKCKNTSTP